MSTDPIARAYRNISAIYEAVAAAANGFPIPGAVLGGTEWNPEDDVIDEIDRLVDWQLENGKSR